MGATALHSLKFHCKEPVHQETKHGLEAGGKESCRPRGQRLECMSLCQRLEPWKQRGHQWGSISPTASLHRWGNNPPRDQTGPYGATISTP